MRQIVDVGIIVLFNEYGRCYVLREISPIFMDSDGISKVVFRAILSFYFFALSMHAKEWRYFMLDNDGVKSTD